VNGGESDGCSSAHLRIPVGPLHLVHLFSRLAAALVSGGASDTTPLFLFGLALYRKSANQPEFLDEAAQNALKWMQYQSPDDTVMVSQLPTSHWRDEQWVMGFALYVNTLVHAYLVLYGEQESASRLRVLMNRLEVLGEAKNPREHEGLTVPAKPYYALYSYKLFNSDRFDLLGNSLAILTGIATPHRARNLVAWIEAESEAMKDRGELALDLPPCLFPYIQPHDGDWRPRSVRFNRPGEYHNGGVWPFICSFYVAACVRAGRMGLAARKLLALTELVKPWHENEPEWVSTSGSRCRPVNPAGAIGRLGRQLCTSTLLSVCIRKAPRSSARSV
jgi:Alkaline and neutral invertase